MAVAAVAGGPSAPRGDGLPVGGDGAALGAGEWSGDGHAAWGLANKPVDAVLGSEGGLCGLLRSRRVQTVRDLVHLTAWELRDWLLVPEEEAEAILGRAWAACASTPSTAYQHLTGPQSSLPSPLPSLDIAAGGGLSGAFVEIAGAPGMGKTQFCLHLAALAASRGGEVFWIDTERTFSAQRLLQLLESISSASEGGVATDNSQALAALQRIRRKVCSSLQELSDLIQELSERLASRDALPSLLVIDSVAAVARIEGDPMAARRETIPRRQAMLNSLASLCKALVAAHVGPHTALRPAVVVTNQVAGDMAGGHKVALGNVWHHAVNWRLVLSYSHPADPRCAMAAGPSAERFLHLQKSPCCAPVVLRFEITTQGLREHSA